MVKRLPTMRKTRVRSLGREDALEKEKATHSRTLAWKIRWMEKRGRLQSMGSQRVRHDWAASLHIRSQRSEESYVFHNSQSRKQKGRESGEWIWSSKWENFKLTNCHYQIHHQLSLNLPFNISPHFPPLPLTSSKSDGFISFPWHHCNNFLISWLVLNHTSPPPHGSQLLKSRCVSFIPLPKH